MPTTRPMLDFEPVPRKYRVDGWTPERQQAFIAALAETGSVRSAAKRINMSPEGAYALRRQPGAESFCRAWNAAIDHGVQNLADAVLDRALNGVPVPIMYKGEQVAERRVYNERTALVVLANRMPDLFGRPGLRPGTKSQDTIAREAAENCPVCRAEREAANDPDEKAALGVMLDTLLQNYMMKLVYERRARLNGDVAAADFTVRQLTQIELMVAAADSSPERIAIWQAAIEDISRSWKWSDEKRAAVVTLTCEMRRMRETVWKGDRDLRPFARPPQDFGPQGMGGGPGIDDRYKVQAQAREQMAAAQALWEAAATEEGWERWREGGGRPVDR
ncbi:hypothetical protein [Sphingomonas immobilis]|uniref:hypothetical protein n=1 Tax=Sphingomonas immobilis TaxID=3063997 RepID=UPI00272BC384|nr:hypothetical protein [Sphingomonas sp. CA1-15]